MPRLDKEFLRLPIAHRALHGSAGPENSRAAIRAAMAHGYAIEIDLQLSADDQAMVFHDYALDRLTDATGPVRQRSAHALGEIGLSAGDGEGIPTLVEILDLVAGAVPILIEVKDQDGAMGPDVGALETATVAALGAYSGPVALMSFNPHSVALMKDLAPDIPRGLVTSAFDAAHWPLPDAVRSRLRAIPDFERCGASFVSHQGDDLSRPRVADLKAHGADILCWTIRSAENEAEARRVAQNITFEGYLPAIPG